MVEVTVVELMVEAIVIEILVELIVVEIVVDVVAAHGELTDVTLKVTQYSCD